MQAVGNGWTGTASETGFVHILTGPDGVFVVHLGEEESFYTQVIIK